MRFVGNLTTWREILTFDIKKYIRNGGKCNYIPGKNAFFQTLAKTITISTRSPQACQPLNPRMWDIQLLLWNEGHQNGMHNKTQLSKMTKDGHPRFQDFFIIRMRDCPSKCGTFGRSVTFSPGIGSLSNSVVKDQVFTKEFSSRADYKSSPVTFKKHKEIL